VDYIYKGIELPLLLSGLRYLVTVFEGGLETWEKAIGLWSVLKL
jgi:hypothetical protein